jgi:hypothetical protein
MYLEVFIATFTALVVFELLFWLLSLLVHSLDHPPDDHSN